MNNPKLSKSLNSIGGATTKEILKKLGLSDNAADALLANSKTDLSALGVKGDTLRILKALDISSIGNLSSQEGASKLMTKLNTLVESKQIDVSILSKDLLSELKKIKAAKGIIEKGEIGICAH